MGLKKDFIINIIIIILFLLISIFLVFSIYYSNTKITNIDINDFTLDNINDYNFCFDSIEKGNNYYTISGWIYKKGDEIKNFETYIVLKEEDSEKAFKIPTSFVKRSDVTEAFSEDNVNYDSCGFSSLIKLNKLDSQKNYRIYILYQNDNKNSILKTDEFIKGA